MNEDAIIKKLLEHDERFQELPTRAEFSELKNTMLENHDEVMKILRRLDDERAATTHALRRHQDTLDDHENRIGSIELRLGEANS